MSKTSTVENRKFKALVLDLKLPRPYILGHLEMLWQSAHLSGEYRFRDAEDVEIACEWQGEPGVFAAALERRRWLDRLPDGRLEIHDYMENAPGYVRDRERQKEWRARQSQTNPGLSRDNNVSVCDNTTLPNPTQPNPTQPKKKEPCPETEKPVSAPPAQTTLIEERVVLTFPCDGPIKTWDLVESKLIQYEQTYETLEVYPEARKAWQWIQDNPENRKTAGGMPKFLTRWFNNAVNKGDNKRKPAKVDLFYGKTEDEIIAEQMRVEALLAAQGNQS